MACTSTAGVSREVGMARSSRVGVPASGKGRKHGLPFEPAALRQSGWPHNRARRTPSLLPPPPERPAPKESPLNSVSDSTRSSMTTANLHHRQSTPSAVGLSISR